MSKRSLQNDPALETHQHLTNELQAAAGLIESLTEPTCPDLTELSKLDEANLEELQAEIAQWRTKSISALEAWESYQQHLKHSADATLLLLSLKSEPDTKKRRCTASSLIPPSNIPIGSKVAFRLPSLQEEWIICDILSESDGIYELQDPESDEDGNPGKIYTGKMKDIIPIHSPDDDFPVWPAGSQVLALYPDTTAFYKAQVVSQKSNKVRLIFEGEEKQRKVTEVARHLVLPLSR